MKTTIKYLILASAFGAVTAHAGEDMNSDKCDNIARIVKAEVAKDKSEVLEIVNKLTRQNPECAANIVVAAIQASNASNSLVGQIVQTAGNAAPGQINSIVSAANGAAPGASAQINAAAQGIGDGGTGNPVSNPAGGNAGTTNTSTNNTNTAQGSTAASQVPASNNAGAITP